MYNPTSFFRKSFIQAFFIATIPFFLQRIANYFYLIYVGEEIEMNVWLINSFYSFLLVGLFGMVLPWLSIIFSSEMLYTRTLGRKEIFNIILSEYLKWFIPITGTLFFTVFISNLYLGSSSSVSYPEVAAISSITFFLSLILAGNSKLAFKMLKFGFPVLGFIALYSDLPLPYKYRNEFSGLAWFSFLSYYFYRIYTYNEDLDLNVPGRVDDENRSIASLSLFSKEFGSTDEKLIKNKNGLKRKLSTLKLIISDASNIYIQILFLMLGISFLISLKHVYNNVLLGNGDFLFVLVSILVLTLFSIILVNPKYLFLNREEFLLSRGATRKEIYLFNWINQIIFVSLVFFLALFCVKSFNDIDILSALDISKIILNLVWFCISGESGILIMFFLLILDFSSYLTSNSSFANLVISTTINIQSLNFSGLLLWFVAVLLRYWDFYKFNNKDIGFFRGVKATIKGLSYSYIIPSFISLIIITFAMFINPLTRFMTLSGFDTSADYLARGGAFIGLFFDSSYNSEDFPFHTSFATGIRILTQDSNNKDGYLYLSDAYLGAITYSKDDIVKNVAILDRERRFNYDFTERNFFIKAKQLLELAKDENSPKYIERLAVINILDKNYDLAEKNILKLIEIDNKPSNKLFLASLYVFLNKNDKALEIYKEEAGKNPNISNIYYQLRSDLYENNKDYKKSLLEYVQAYRLNKNIHLPRASYFSTNLCSDLKELNIKYENDQTEFSKSIKNYLYFCENGIYLERPKYLQPQIAFIYGYLKKYNLNISNEYISYLLSKNKTNIVEEKFLSNNWIYKTNLKGEYRDLNLKPYNVDFLIFKEINKGNIEKASILLKTALSNQYYNNNEYSFYNKIVLNPNLYLAKLKLEFKNERDPSLKLNSISPTESDKKNIEKFNYEIALIKKRIGNIPDAKRFLLTSDNIDESFNILTNKFNFSKSEKQELEKVVLNVKKAINLYNQDNKLIPLTKNNFGVLKHFSYVKRVELPYLFYEYKSLFSRVDFNSSSLSYTDIGFNIQGKQIY